MLMIGKLLLIGIAAVAIFSMMTMKPVSADEWWKPFKYEKWNCCNGGNGGEFKFEDDSKHDAKPENDQKIEITQKCEHVEGDCTIDLSKLNDQKASSDQDYKDESKNEFTDKSDNEYTAKDNEYTSKDNEYKGEKYDNGHDHGGVYDSSYGGHGTHDAFGNGLSQADLDNIHKNGLKINILAVPKGDPSDYHDIAISAGDGENSYAPVTATFHFGDDLHGNAKSATYEYYYAPGVISVGEDFNICIKNLDSGNKNCDTGINHSEHEPEEITLGVPL